MDGKNTPGRGWVYSVYLVCLSEGEKSVTWGMVYLVCLVYLVCRIGNPTRRTRETR